MEHITYSDLTTLQRIALDAAAEAMETAYSPYSHFFVGAALATTDGKTVTGSNVENAAYGSTICAERAAILRANAQHMRSFECIAIIARGETFNTTQITAPCGSCRQMIYELSQISGNDIECVLATTKKDKIIITTINQLLPLAFGPADLGIDVERYRT